MKRTSYILLPFTLLLMACGQGVVQVDQRNYEPKIVIEGYLYPGQAVTDIRISRNFPLNTPISRDELPLGGAEVQLTDESAGNTYTLSYDSSARAFYLPDSTFLIHYDQSYSLHVRASVDGQSLIAGSQTHTPLPGFAIDKQKSTAGMSYLKKDSLGQLQKPRIYYSRSPQTDFYAFSIVALNGDLDHFIYPPKNPFVFPSWTTQDIKDNLDTFIHRQTIVLNAPLNGGTAERELEWFNFMFYGRYRIIGYATDENFKDYFLTYQRVVEMDGNLHEPVFHISGDGIGVFASAISDTAYLEITAE